MRSTVVTVTIALMLVASEASASTELNGLFDARSMGMGGTGVAWLDSGGAVPTNPALLDQIGNLTLTLNAFLFISQPTAPYRITHDNGMGGTVDRYESIRSDTIIAPLGYIGGAFRLHDRIVFGVGVGPMIGQGTQAKYKPAPEIRPDLEIDNKAAAGLLELNNSLSFRLTDTLSLGAGWRITYMTQSITTPLPGRQLGGTVFGPDKQPVYGDIDVHGVNFAGLQLGLLWRPDPAVRFGFSYRSKVTTVGTGTTKSKNPLDGSPISLDTEQPFPTPHMFRAGIALSTMSDRLLFAADVKYMMYAEAWKSLDTTTTRNGMKMTTHTPTNWKDAYNVHLGGEYTVSDALRVRAGYILSTTATPEVYAKAFMAPPGVAHCWTAGLGLKLGETFSLDFAGSFIHLASEIDAATPENAGAGLYASTTGEISVSATYHN
jgi:long-chain fatty acid transport protein